MNFDIFESVKSKGQLCSNELLLAKTYSKDLIPLWNKIAECTDKDEMQRLKKRLPGVTWQAHFPGGRRVNADAEPSGLYMLDIDGVENPARVYNEKVAAHINECHIMVVHMTPSRHGLRIVAMCQPEFATIEQNQRWLAEQLDVEIDEACKDLARFSYLVPHDYFLYFDNSVWTASNERVQTPPDLRETSNVMQETPSPVRGDKEGSNQDSYRGLRLQDIANKWLELNGGEPQPGERNTVLFELATRMRYITEFNPKVIASVIPHCGLPDEEILSLCRSACSTQRSTKMPSDLRMVLKNLEKQNSNDPLGSAAWLAQERPTTNDPLGSAAWLAQELPTTRSALTLGLSKNDQDEDSDVSDEDFLLRMPRLPIGLRESLYGVPDKVKMPILCGIMPLAMSYATDVRVKYCDGKMQRLNLMAIIWGRQASGKSAVKDVIDIWKRPMKEADAANRKAEDAYKHLRKSRKANEKLPEEPHNPILEVPITISCSTLLKRLKNAHGKHLFSFGEELDTLRKTNGAGSWSSKYDVYRLAFDNGEWGQDYNSDQAESGMVDVAYNWTVLGTRGAVEKCFKGDSVENGMSGRVLFAKMPSSQYEYMPKYSVNDNENCEESDDIQLALSKNDKEHSDRRLRKNRGRKQKIEEAVHILSNSQGYVDTPRLRRTMQFWCDQKADEARMSQDEVLDVFRKRAAVIGFRCGVVFQLLENGKPTFSSSSTLPSNALRRHCESINSLNFAILMAEYALKYQTELFGNKLAEVSASQAAIVPRKTKNKTLFDELPDEFTYDMLRTAKPGAKYNALRFMVYNWKHNGQIEVVEQNRWRKVGKNG